MLSNIRKRKAQGGFTLIEVMIVLAIAGLILLVVFLAVPALQRNARNTQRREDAGNLLSAVSEFIANNNGSLPAVQANLGSGSAATLGSGAGVNTVPINLGYYDAANIAVKAYAAGLTTTTDTLTIVTGATCTGNTLASGNSRSTAVIYTLEVSVTQCRAS
ncbi:MAG TPA: type II secretion system protein [Patescibacteria group bacterium]|nr:type II secretion system protein [Patescibacteria group bacterium]